MRFEKQTYTQTPNSLFLEMKNMDECELKVVLLICRYTFGYHRDEVKLSTRRIADEIGMNTASVQKGADKAIERGLIEKVIDGNKTTTWRALVSDSEIESPMIQKLNRGVSDNESLSGVKESIKKDKEIESFFTAEEQAQNETKMQAILSHERLVQERGDFEAWRGRELLPPHYIQFGDWWYSQTGMHMYGAKAKAKMDAVWLKELQKWHENDLTVFTLQNAYNHVIAWKKVVSKMSDITATAISMQAAGAKMTSSIPAVKVDEAGFPESY